MDNGLDSGLDKVTAEIAKGVFGEARQKPGEQLHLLRSV